MWILLISLTLVCMLSAFGPARTYAEMSITVGPSLFELRATPGGTGSYGITVSNTGSEPVTIRTAVEQYKDAPLDHSAVSWMQVEPPELSLQPGAQQTVMAKVGIPPGAHSGGYFAQISFLTAAPPQSPNQTAVAARLGVPFLITVDGAGALVSKGELKLVPVLENGEVGFQARLVNHGNVHLASRGGSVQVRRPDGSIVGRADLAQSTAILPNTAGLLTGQGSLQLSSLEEYRAIATLSLADGSTLTADASFKPVAKLDVSEVVLKESEDGQTLALVQLSNRGELGLLPRVQIEILDGQGAFRAGTPPLIGDLLEAGEVATLQAALPGSLPRGGYTVRAKADYGATTTSSGEHRVGAGDPSVSQPATSSVVERAAEAQSGGFESLLGPVVWGIMNVLVLALFTPPFAPLRRRLHRAALALRQSD